MSVYLTVFYNNPPDPILETDIREIAGDEDRFVLSGLEYGECFLRFWFPTCREAMRFLNEIDKKYYNSKHDITVTLDD